MDLDEGSITYWIGRLKQGDGEASKPLWDRYFERLVQLARKRLAEKRGTGLIEDEEDAALSALDSFYAGVSRDRFPELTDRDDLWRLLVVITARKVSDQVERQRRQKRGGGRVREEAALSGPAPDGDAGGLDQVAGTGPTPEFTAMMVEEYHRRLDALGDETLRQVAVRKMEGYTNEEIAGHLGCSPRTVAYRLETIRRLWLEAQPGGKPEVHVYDDERLVYSGRLVRPLELGRQDQEDPPPFSLIRKADHQRLVIAGLEDRHVSRRQVRIEPHDGGEEIRIVNVSQSVSVRIWGPSAGRQGSSALLEPGTATSISSTSVAVLDFGQIVIRVTGSPQCPPTPRE